MTTRRSGALGLLVLTLGLVALPLRAGAAEPPRPAEIGDRVRVSILDAAPRTGILLAQRIDALEIALAPDSTLRIAREQIVALEVARRHGKAATGAIVGLLFGVTVTTVVVSTRDQGSLSGVGMGALIASGVLAVALGALIGDSIQHERWEPAPLP
jgi:hypothetical protein